MQRLLIVIPNKLKGIKSQQTSNIWHSASLFKPISPSGLALGLGIFIWNCMLSYGLKFEFIAQKTNYDRKTVRKYINKNSFNINADTKNKKQF